MESADRKFFVLICVILCYACDLHIEYEIPGLGPFFGPVDPKIQAFSDCKCQGQMEEIPFASGTSYSPQEFQVLGDNSISSLRLTGLRKGDVIQIYDDPEGKADRSWAIITVLIDIAAYCVSDFEKSYSDDKVDYYYYENGAAGLTGKVSFIKMTRNERVD